MAGKRTTAAEDEAAVRAKIAGWPDPYAALGERLHEIVLEAAPDLRPRLWYGAAGYARGSGPVLVFFRVDEFLSFGLTEKAALAAGEGPDGQLVGAAWYLRAQDGPVLTPATEARVAEVVARAAG